MYNIDDMWARLSDIPIDDDECIEEPFEDFEAGTHRFYIWHWFDEITNGGVYDLLYSDKNPS